MRIPFKFVIVNSLLEYWKVVPGGPPVAVASPDPIFVDPSIVDWPKLTLNYKRDSTYLGVIRSYSPDMIQFVKDSANILRFIKNTEGGIEAIAYLGMYVWNDTTLVYDFVDYWQFDFSQTSNQLNFFQIALMEGGISALLKAYGTQNYNVPLNDPDIAPPYPIYNPVLPDILPTTPPIPAGILPPPPVPVQVFCDGIPILGSFQFISDQTVAPGPVYTGETVQLQNDYIVHQDIFTIGMSDFKDLGDYGGSVGNTNLPLPGKVPQADPLADSKCFQAQPFAMPFKMRISWNLNFNWETFFSGGGHAYLQLRYIITDGTASHGGAGNIVSTGILAQDTIGLGSSGISAQFQWTGESDFFDMEANYCLFIGFSYTTTGSIVGFTGPRVYIAPLSAPPTQPLACIELNYQFVPTNSVVRCITQFQLFDYLRALMCTNGGLSGPAYSARSNLLTTHRDPTAPGNQDLDPTCTMFTCADALRGLKTVTISDPNWPVGNPDFPPGSPIDVFIVPAIYTNMADFAKDLLVNLCASIGIEKTSIGSDVLVAETLDYFFDDTKLIADVGSNISDFEKTDFNDYRGSTIAMGQNDQQFDSINGPNETMSEVNWTTVITRINKDIDMKTPYIESPYSVELFRANIGNKTNVNSSSDNDTCKLQVVDLIPHEVLDLEFWGGISGYAFTTYALRLLRTNSITSGLPASILTPEVNPYSMYNMCFSPQRKAQRLLPWLTSNYRGLVNKLLSLNGFKKNIQVISQIFPGGPTITESDYINVANTIMGYTPPFKTDLVVLESAETLTGRANAQIFLPYVFSFKSKVQLDLPTQMTPPGTPGGGNMYGKVKFTFIREGQVFNGAGFVLDIGILPGTNDTYTYKLLCSPSVVIPDWL